MIVVEQVGDTLDQSMEKLLWEVIHSTPGRLRIRVTYLANYPQITKRIETAIASINGVTEVCLNPLTNSIVIYYNTEIITEENLRQKLLDIIVNITPLQWIQKQVMSQTNQPQAKKTEEVEQTVLIKIQEVGGKLIGASVGKAMGVSVGAVTGGILLGPLGLISGSKVGSVIGRMFGSQVGGDTVRYWVSQNNEEDSNNNVHIAVVIQQSLERGASELIGETIGGIAGVAIGSMVLGPAGMLVGSLVGGLIGGQVAEEFWYEQAKIKQQ